MANPARMVLISIGANLVGPDGALPLQTCQRAAAALDALPGLRLRGLSRWFATDPVLPAGTPEGAQPAYVNAVAHLMVEPGGTIEPAGLLRQTMALEAAAGRVRGAPNAARVLDLDIVAIGAMVRHAPDPVLPHPRAHQRAFVLVPLAELVPGWVHPVLGRTVEALIAEVAEQAVRAIG